MKLMIAAMLLMTTTANAATQWDCGRYNVTTHWWGHDCRKGEGFGHGVPSPASVGTPERRDSPHPHGGPVGTPTAPSGPAVGSPEAPGTPGGQCTANCGGGGGNPPPGGGKGKHKNNGWGNGDQDAPGHSLNHNGAENDQTPGHKGKSH
jgi:hypothetical protein